MKYKILAVDDEPANTRMLERLLRDHYDVVCAQSGEEALEALNVYDVALIISDQRMPGMTGVEFLKRSAEIRPHCVRIILTGYTDAADLVDALNSGVVYKYVTKPWVNTDLLQTVKRGLSHHETIKAQHRLNLENERLRERALRAEDANVDLCFEMSALKNEWIREHAPRVSELAVLVGNAMHMDSESLESLRIAARLHAVSDVYVPNGLRRRTDKLTVGERDFVRRSRERGLQLISNLSNSEVVDAIRYATEHFDGSGLPEGLRSAQIPLASRIIAVAKAYDQIMFPESGAAGPSEEKAMIELHSRAGRDLDPQIVKALCGLLVLNEMQRHIPSERAAVALS